MIPGILCSVEEPQHFKTPNHQSQFEIEPLFVWATNYIAVLFVLLLTIPISFLIWECEEIVRSHKLQMHPETFRFNFTRPFCCRLLPGNELLFSSSSSISFIRHDLGDFRCFRNFNFIAIGYDWPKGRRLSFIEIRRWIERELRGNFLVSDSLPMPFRRINRLREVGQDNGYVERSTLVFD